MNEYMDRQIKEGEEEREEGDKEGGDEEGGEEEEENQSPKGIKWSAVPLPCSTFSLVFMGQAGQWPR